MSSLLLLSEVEVVAIAALVVAAFSDYVRLLNKVISPLSFKLLLMFFKFFDSSVLHQ